MPNRNSDAILLLNVQFSETDSQAHKPLDAEEWQKLSVFLNNNKNKDVLPKSPEDLFKINEEEFNCIEAGTGLSKERLKGLLSRGSGLAIMREKWEAAGLWCLTAAEEEFPEIWKNISNSSQLIPAVIYGAGNKNVLKELLVGIVGEKDKFPKNLFSYLCSKGINTVAPLSTNNLGTNLPTVGILFDNLEQQATSKRYREAIANAELTLISFCSPEVRRLSEKEKEKTIKYFNELPNAFIQMKNENSLDIGKNKNIWTYVRGFINQEGSYVNLQNCKNLVSSSSTSKKETKNKDIPLISINIGYSNRNQSVVKITESSSGKPSHNITSFPDNQGEEKGTSAQQVSNDSLILPYTKDSGNLLPADSIYKDPSFTSQLDGFSQFLLGFLEKRITLKEFQSQASSEFLTKSALSKWLKKAVEKGVVQEYRIKRKKFYQKYI